jgi:iron complex outermembrane receptor protein
MGLIMKIQNYAAYIPLAFIFGFGDVLAQDLAPSVGGKDERAVQEIVVESTGMGQTLSDQAQPVTVLAGRELDMKASSSLGDTLASEPGIASGSFGPGAARPVIRGLGGDRIRVLENGVGTQDISAISPDHAVTIESALVDKIEVVRGPASLLYGTSAVGGVVNVFDNRIPEKLPDGPVQGTAEVRGESVSKSRAALVSVTTPVDNVALHFDGFTSKSDDYDIPGYARTEALRESTPLEYPEPRGVLPWSDTQTDILTGGGSYIFENGFMGAAVNDYKTIYGVPNGEEDVSINAHRRRLDLRGGVRDTGGFIESGSVRAGLVDYDHTEFAQGEVGTKMKSDGFDSRIDLKHADLGGVKGTWGAQGGRNDFSAVGEEAFQPPSVTDTYSLFLLEEVATSDTLTLQAGGRYDWNKVATDGFDEDLSSDDLTREHNLFSQSAGAVWDVATEYSLAWSLAHTERAPNAQELFADGPHVATGAYEIGDPDLAVERSLGNDLALRRTVGAVRGSIGGFYNRFWNYISANPTGGTEDGLPVYAFESVPADFWGFESQVAYFIDDSLHRELSFDFQPDYVWARNRDTHDYISRVPPLRMKFGVNYYRSDLLRARLELQHVFEQDKVAEYETTTDAYSMLNIYLSKEVDYNGKIVEVFLKGTNLLGEKARNHVSFIKDVAPLPGASALAGVRINF